MRYSLPFLNNRVRHVGIGWAKDFKPEHLSLLGFFEVAAAVSLIIALFVDPLEMLAPMTGVGIALYMSAAIATHLRRLEYPRVAENLMWLSLALFVAYDSLIEVAV